MYLTQTLRILIRVIAPVYNISVNTIAVVYHIGQLDVPEMAIGEKSGFNSDQSSC